MSRLMFNQLDFMTFREPEKPQMVLGERRIVPFGCIPYQAKKFLSK